MFMISFVGRADDTVEGTHGIETHATCRCIVVGQALEGLLSPKSVDRMQLPPCGAWVLQNTAARLLGAMGCVASGISPAVRASHLL